MRKTITAVLAAAATVPLLLLGATAASASPSYLQNHASASADGAWDSGVQSSAGHDWDHGYWGHDGWDHDGWACPYGWGHEGPSYLQTEEHADANGASSALTAAGTDGWGHSHFLDSAQQAGPDGASSDLTAAHS